MQYVPLIVTSLLLFFACMNQPKKDEDREISGRGLIDGNGGSGLSYRNNPWFLGDEVVNYCILRHPDFPASDEQVATIVREVIDNWMTSIDHLTLKQNEEDLQARNIKYAKQYIHSAECTQDSDLTFSFAMNDLEISKILQYNSKNLLGIAALTDYSIEHLRGRGIVYIAPDKGPDAYKNNELKEGFWADHDKLFDVLLHEFGHVMGFDHDNSSFMFESYPGRRVLLDRPGRMSVETLVKRNAVFTEDYELCGIYWYHNGENDLVRELAEARELCYQGGDFNNFLVARDASGDEIIKYTVKYSNSGGVNASSQVITQSEELILATYADNFFWHAALYKGDEAIPFTMKLNADGYELQFFDAKKATWNDIATLSKELLVFNERFDEVEGQ